MPPQRHGANKADSAALEALENCHEIDLEPAPGYRLQHRAPPFSNKAELERYCTEQFDQIIALSGRGPRRRAKDRRAGSGPHLA